MANLKVPTNAAEAWEFVRGIEEPHYVLMAILLAGLLIKYSFFQPSPYHSLSLAVRA